MEGHNSIKSVQMAFITFFAQTGVAIIMLPSTLAKEVGHDGWISVLITGAITILLGIFVVLLLRRYSDKDIYAINRLIFGKIIGFVFNLLLVLYLSAATIGGASLFIDFIRITLLQQTPLWVLAPFITLPSFYLVWQGLKHMGRFLQISILNYVIILIFLILLYRNFRISFLMPLGEAGITRILHSIKTSFFAFTGFELIVFFYPWITDRNKALKWHIYAIFASTVFYGIVISVSTAVFGENLLSILAMPFFNLSRIYNAPILERVDLYLIGLWYIPMACSMRCYIFAAYDSLQKVFKLRKTKFSYTAYFIIVLALSSLPKDINQVFKFIEINNMMAMGITLFLLLCLSLSFIRKKGVSIK